MPKATDNMYRKLLENDPTVPNAGEPTAKETVAGSRNTGNVALLHFELDNVDPEDPITDYIEWDFWVYDLFLGWINKGRQRIDFEEEKLIVENSDYATYGQTHAVTFPTIGTGITVRVTEAIIGFPTKP
jgi:hypothetical protein